MPLISPQDNLDFLMNAVPGRRERIQEEERQQATDMQDPLDILAGLRERITPITQSLYPGNPLSTEETTRLGELSRRQRRLAPAEPLQYGQVGSARNPGNPYSIDTRGAAQGIGNLAVALINRQKEKRRGSFEDELVDLSTRQESEEQRKEATQRMIEQLAPDLVNQEYQSSRDEAGRDFNAEQAEIDRYFEYAMGRARTEDEKAMLETQLENDKELLQLRHTLETDPNNPDIQSRYVSAVRDQIDAMEPFYEINRNRLNDVRGRIDDLRGQRTSLTTAQQEELDRLRTEESTLLEDISRASSRMSQLWQDSQMGIDAVTPAETDTTGVDVSDIFN